MSVCLSSSKEKSTLPPNSMGFFQVGTSQYEQKRIFRVYKMFFAYSLLHVRDSEGLWHISAYAATWLKTRFPTYEKGIMTFMAASGGTYQANTERAVY